MKNLRFYSLFLLFLLFACQNKEATIYELRYPNMQWHWAAIQKQLADTASSTLSCCHEEVLKSTDAREIFEKSFEFSKTESLEKYTRQLPAYKTNIYANFIYYGNKCQTGFLLKTIAFEDKHYLWANIDIGHRFFWTNSNLTAVDTQQILFDYKYFSWDRAKIKIPFKSEMSRDTDFNNQYGFNTATKFFTPFNNQFYLEAINRKGYIFGINKLNQISELNRFLQDNTAFHKVQNKYKIDSFLMLLHDGLDGNMYKKINFYKKEIDTVKLKIKGFDYTHQAIYYFDSIVSIPYSPSLQAEDYYYKKVYSHYVYNIDSLLIMQEYLDKNLPTFLYYKDKGNHELPWQNYFLAYYLVYTDDGRPTINKVDIIIPKRMYYYNCYSSGWCDDIGPSPYYLAPDIRKQPQKINSD